MSFVNCPWFSPHKEKVASPCESLLLIFFVCGFINPFPRTILGIYNELLNE